MHVWRGREERELSPRLQERGVWGGGEQGRQRDRQREREGDREGEGERERERERESGRKGGEKERGRGRGRVSAGAGDRIAHGQGGCAGATRGEEGGCVGGYLLFYETFQILINV